MTRCLQSNITGFHKVTRQLSLCTSFFLTPYAQGAASSVSVSSHTYREYIIELNTHSQDAIHIAFTTDSFDQKHRMNL